MPSLIRFLIQKENLSEMRLIKDISLGEFLDSIISGMKILNLFFWEILDIFMMIHIQFHLTYYSVAQGSYFQRRCQFYKRRFTETIRSSGRIHNQTWRGSYYLIILLPDLITENNKLTGVEYKKKRGSSQNYLTAFADEIIANAAMPNIAELLPEEYGTKLKDAIGTRNQELHFLQYTLDSKKYFRDIGHNHYSTFVFDSSVKTQADILENNKGDFQQEEFYIYRLWTD